MSTKICAKCKTEKGISEFYKQKNHSFGVMSYCKNCFNKACMQRWIKRKIHYVNLLGGKCEDCALSLENSHYSVFEFHRNFDQEKDATWVKLRLRTHNAIMKELNKCSLLCANCHRIRHANFRDLDFPEQPKFT